MASMKKPPLPTPSVLGDLSMLKANTPDSSTKATAAVTPIPVKEENRVEAVVPEIKAAPVAEPASVVTHNLTSETVTGTTEKTKPTTDQLQKVAINLKIPEYLKNDWKVFFVSHGLTITDGIVAAVNYLEQQVENGSVTLGAISINKN